MRGWGACCVGAIVAILAMSDVVCADAPTESVQDDTKRYDIDIADVSFGDALIALARQTDKQLFFPYDLADVQDVQAVSGQYTVDEALDLMLRNTGFSGGLTESGVIIVTRSPNDNNAVQGETVMTQNENEMPVKRRGLLGVLAAVFSVGAGAQEVVDTDEVELELEEIVVTGSRIRGAQSASPVVTITRQEIDRAGFGTVEELIEKLPQNFGAGGSLDSTTSRTSNVAVGSSIDNISAGFSVNLRGLGASSTLILLNGRRMSPSGATARFTDISAIPVTAIERVEVLTDGASAIYGSDAIGGVVNFILRDNYEGAETRLRYGSDSGGDTSEVLFGQSLGASWDDGNILFTYEYYKHDNLAYTDRDFLSTTDLTRFGGTDWRSQGGNPGNVFAGDFSGFFAIPAGQVGTSLAAADFDPTAPPNMHNIHATDDFLPESERHSAFMHLTQNIGSAEVFAEARFTTRENRRIFDPTLRSFFVTDTNPYFVDPTGTGLTSVFVSNYSLVDDMGPAIISADVDSFGAALGVTFDIGRNWKGELAGNWSKEENMSTTDNRLDSVAFDIAVNGATLDTAFNPFADGSNTNPTVLESFRSSAFLSSSELELWTVSFNVDGSAFDVPGGSVQLATGLEFREESLTAIIEETDPPNGLSRDVTALYAELFFPLVSDTNSRPGVQRFEFSLAGRYEDYSDFGDTVNPKVGFVWSPTQSLTFRGTWGTSFRAPALFDIDPNNPVNRFRYLPESLAPGALPFSFINLAGGNESLQAEEATTWTTGLQLRPERIEGFSLSLTYFNIDFEDQISTPVDNLITAAADPRFASIRILNPTPEQIAVLVNDPRWEEEAFGVTTPSADVLSGAVPVAAIIDTRKTNLSQSVVTGVELQLSYDFETALGSFDIGLNGNYLFDFERRLLAADPLVEEVDTLGRPVDLRARANVTWSLQRWAVSGFLNYVDAYTDNVSDPDRPIDSWTTVDLNIAYETGDNSGFLSDTRISLTTQNLFDEDPPFADTVGGLAYDIANHNGLGRFVSFQITKEW